MSQSAASNAIEWETDIRLMTHPLMLANFAKLIVITGAIMAALMSFMALVTDDAKAIPQMLLLTGICLGIIAVLFALVSLVFFRNRMHMRFKVDGKGAEVEMIDKRALAANKVAVVAGVLAGKPGVAGAGLIAASNTRQQTVWNAVAKVHFHKAWRVISLSNGWRTIVTLYCTEANYDAVASLVERAMSVRSPAARGKHKNPLPRLLLHTALIIVACVPLFHLPDLEESALLPALLVLAFALASLWLIPVLAWAMYACLGWLAVLEVLAESEMRTSIFDGSSYRAYEVMSDNDYAQLAVTAIGAAYLVWLTVGLMRGRIRSALAGDMAEMEGA